MRLPLCALLLWPAVPVLAQAETPALTRAAPLLPAVVGTSELYGADPLSALALGGRDAVGYFVDAAARPGRAGLEIVSRGVVWRFANEANRSAFAQDPDSFRPRLGGYDALAAARGALVAGDPAIFTVRAGRLYLFRQDASRLAFEADPALGSRAEAAWSGLRATLSQD